MSKFEEWKAKAPKHDLCINSIISGGPGYVGFDHCEIYPEVRYGGKMCPEDCASFDEACLSELYEAFKRSCPKDVLCETCKYGDKLSTDSFEYLCEACENTFHGMYKCRHYESKVSF